jgi:formylglycine-generating enzyme required for sulfatase activity
VRVGLVALLSLAGLGSASSNGRVVRVEAPKRVEVRVPAGRFWMGVDEDTAKAAAEQCNNAFPALIGNLQNGTRLDFCGDYFNMLHAMAPREVFVSAFLIDRDEVSVEEYRACVVAGACDLDPLVAGDERYIKDGWPLVNVNWFEAQDYCRWRGARLPTEAEWERAARGDNASAIWPWGDLEQPKDFNHGMPRAQAMREIERTPAPTPVQFFGDPDDSDGVAILAKPGSYVWGEGPYGTRDQAGNVAEWVADALVHDAKVKGYDNLDRADPYRAPNSYLFDQRVVRGGSWRQPIFVARSNLRDPFNAATTPIYTPKARFSHVGFRCARSAPRPEPGGLRDHRD